MSLVRLQSWDNDSCNEAVMMNKCTILWLKTIEIAGVIIELEVSMIWPFMIKEKKLF